MMNERVLLLKKKKGRQEEMCKYTILQGWRWKLSPEMPLTSVIYNATVSPVNSLNEGAVS